MPNPQDYALMQKALREAQESLRCHQLPVGAVIATANGNVVGAGCKSPLAHWRLAHAEIAALADAIPGRHDMSREESDRFLAGLTLYTTLEPCLMCIGAIMNCRIPRVVYALEDPYGGGVCLLGERKYLPPRHEQEYPDVVKGILREESRALFAEFFQVTKNAFWRNPENPLVKLCSRPAD